MPETDEAGAANVNGGGALAQWQDTGVSVHVENGVVKELDFRDRPLIAQAFRLVRRHWLGVEPVESTPAARIVTARLPDDKGSVFLAKNKKLGLHISEGAHNTREGNTLLFGTWDHPPFVFNEDGTISPMAKT